MNTEDCIVETSEKTQVDNEIVGQASRDDLMANDPARDDLLILVDGRDREIGTATKLQAHVEGTLHRAFSVVLLRDGEEGPELLLAKRSMAKYHSGGLWANSCCSHPRVGEQRAPAKRFGNMFKLKNHSLRILPDSAHGFTALLQPPSSW